tara:strand:+ start:29411 stop:29719 length:309 start_codon:yes stop_codon:yes gene_type:complete
LAFFDTFLLPERCKINLVGKVYFNDKLYLFSRNELETETGNYGNVPSFYRLSFIVGACYDVSDNFLIEVKSNVQQNSSSMSVLGESLIEMPTVYALDNKFKI